MTITNRFKIIFYTNFWSVFKKIKDDLNRKIRWIFFDEIPDLKTTIGIILIVLGGIYIFIREKAQDQNIVTEKPLR